MHWQTRVGKRSLDVAAAALGPENVTGVMLPSRYSSAGARDDAIALAKALGLKECPTVEIEAAHAAVSETLKEASVDPAGLTDENVQARLRGLLLMAMSNARSV